MSSHLDMAWPEIDESRVDDFARKGYLLLHDFASPDFCEALRKKILNFAKDEKIIAVRWRDSTFDTFNGHRVDENFPELAKLYDQNLLHELRKLKPFSLAPISDRRVGISVNLTGLNGKFQPHFDRNMVTAILYANDDYAGGQMVFYPRLRLWLGHLSNGGVQRRVQRFLDKIVRSDWYLRYIANKVKIKPKSGDLLIFEGSRTYHMVAPVTSGSARVSIQFAYDLPGVVFDVSEYYGK